MIENESRLLIGDGTVIHPLAAVGGVAQHSSRWLAPVGRIRIGKHVRIHAFATVDLPMSDDSETLVGDDCVLMHYSHVAHDCTIGHKVTLCNGVQLAGHVRVYEGATLGLGALVHQRLKIGAYAMIGMGAVVTHDVPPFSLARGTPARVVGLNVVGMQRNGFTDEEIAWVREHAWLRYSGAPMNDGASERVRLIIEAYEQ